MSGANEAVWTVRLTRRAFAEIEVVWQHVESTAGEALADAWQEGLETVLASLATLPERFPVAELESVVLGFPARRAIYRRTRGGPAYLVFFRLLQTADDAPMVQVLHIRHGAQEPLSKEEAEVIASSLDD